MPEPVRHKIGRKYFAIVSMRQTGLHAGGNDIS